MSFLLSHRSGELATAIPGDSGGGPVEIVQIAIPANDYNDTLAAVRQRIADGEGTPVLASHLDALGLRGLVEDLARETSP